MEKIPGVGVPTCVARCAGTGSMCTFRGKYADHRCGKHTKTTSLRTHQCSICMSDDVPTARVVRTKCGHEYCGQCLCTWLRRCHTCPICRCALYEPPAEAPEAVVHLHVRVQAATERPEEAEEERADHQEPTGEQAGSLFTVPLEILNLIRRGHLLTEETLEPGLEIVHELTNDDGVIIGYATLIR